MDHYNRLLVLLVCALLLGAAHVQAQVGEGLTLVEAVQATLAQDLSIRQQDAQIERQAANLLAARSPFETSLSTTASYGRDRSPLTALQRTQFDGITETISDATGLEASAQRLFRSGLVLRPSLTLSRSNLDVGGTLAGDARPVFVADNLARFELLAVQPLLRGRGSAVVAAGERAARLGVDAARHQRDHVASLRVLNTVLAYWQYVAAAQRLAIVDESQARAIRLFDEMTRLVDADRLPRADLDPLRADLADKEATAVLAAQAVDVARQQLGQAMGLTQEQARRLAPASDDFSALPDALDSADIALDFQALTAQAMQRRNDLAAQQGVLGAADVLRRAAGQQRRHRLDLSAAVGYTGLDNGDAVGQFFSPVATNVGGLNFSAALRYDLPVSNRAARGAYAQADADYSAERLAEEQVMRQIAFDVDLARDDVAASAAAYSSTRRAVGFHRQALESERAKFRQGFSTLFNVILFQDRLTFAESRWIDAQARLAAALVRLRFETGTLPLPSAQSGPLRLDGFTSLPDAP